MGITAFEGPLVAAGAGPSLTGIGQYNDTPGPSSFAHGSCLLDSRFGYNRGADVTSAVPSWYGAGFICVMDQAPSTLSATNIVPAAVPVAGTPMTLAAASTGITVVPTGGFTLISGQTFAAGALMIDGNPAFNYAATPNTSTGTGGVSMYDPRTTSQRALTVTTNASEAGNTMQIVAYDYYGNLVHQTVTLPSSATTVTTTKTFKAIVSCTVFGTPSGSNISVGTADVYGFGLAAYEQEFMIIYWNGALIAIGTGTWTAAVTTSPATAATGDVRGTYAVASASNGTKKLQMWVMPQSWNLSSTGLFGTVQF
jgi:hypothetical protein